LFDRFWFFEFSASPRQPPARHVRRLSTSPLFSIRLHPGPCDRSLPFGIFGPYCGSPAAVDSLPMSRVRPSSLLFVTALLTPPLRFCCSPSRLIDSPFVFFCPSLMSRGPSCGPSLLAVFLFFPAFAACFPLPR